MSWHPSEAEAAAAEKTLSEAAGQSPDGYWRALAEDVLVEAHEAGKRERAEGEMAGAR